jgi:membrane protease YdiL (CAAX protease family)
MKEKRHIYTPVFISVIILLIILMKTVDASLLNRDNEYIAIILLECVIFAIPGIIFTRLTASRDEKIVKLSALKPNTVVIMLLAVLILISGSILYGYLISNYDTDHNIAFNLYDVFTAKYADSFGEIVYLILAYAFIPAFFEEFTFRGIVCAKYEAISPVYAIIMSSITFAFIHLDYVMLPFYIFSGLIFAIVIYSVDSVLITIAVHFIYNLFFIFCPMYISSIYSSGKELLLFLCGIVFFGSLAFLCSECRTVFRRKAESDSFNSSKDNSIRLNPLEVFLSPTAIICYLIYFAAVVIF